MKVLRVRDWDVRVTQEHIDKAEPGVPSRCMIAIALRSSIGAWSVAIDRSVIRFNHGSTRYMYPTPKQAIGWLLLFDKDRKKAKPFTLRLRGAYGTMGPVIFRGPIKKPKRHYTTNKKPKTLKVTCPNRRYRPLVGSKVVEVRYMPALKE